MKLNGYDIVSAPPASENAHIALEIRCSTNAEVRCRLEFEEPIPGARRLVHVDVEPSQYGLEALDVAKLVWAVAAVEIRFGGRR